MKRITYDLLYLNYIKNLLKGKKMLRNSLLIALILFASSYAQLAQPKLVLKQNNFDFGDIKQGETVEHTFVLSNGGEALLKITDVRASCGCTAAVTEKKELKPGESTKLLVKFNSTGRRGKQNKTVSISSNDPQNPFHINFSTEDIIDCKQPVTEEDVQKMQAALRCYKTYESTIEQTGIMDFVSDEISFEFYQENFDPHVKDIAEGLG